MTIVHCPGAAQLQPRGGAHTAAGPPTEAAAGQAAPCLSTCSTSAGTRDRRPPGWPAQESFSRSADDERGRRSTGNLYVLNTPSRLDGKEPHTLSADHTHPLDAEHGRLNWVLGTAAICASKCPSDPAATFPRSATFKATQRSMEELPSPARGPQPSG